MCLSGLPILLISSKYFFFFLSINFSIAFFLVSNTWTPRYYPPEFVTQTCRKNYVRPESDRPRLSESSACDDVPVIDLGLEDRTQVVKLIAEACKSYGSFQVTNHGVSLEAVEKMLEVAQDRVL